MAMLFMDPLDLWLMLLGVTLFAAACAVFLNVVREKRNDDCNKGLGAYFMGVGIYALVAGLWGMMTWPLPGSNNIVSDRFLRTFRHSKPCCWSGAV